MIDLFFLKNMNINLLMKNNDLVDKVKSIKKERQKFIKDVSYTKIKTFEDACRVLNIVPNIPVDIINIEYEFNKSIVAHYKLCIIIRAINRGWVCDFNDKKQYKFYNVFIYSGGSGLRFSLSYSLYDYTNTIIGARLCFESREKAEYAAHQFLKLYDEYFSGQ
jgi:hypothetical protein